MDYERIASMLDKTFAWAVTRTFSREEAEELAQEIVFQAVVSIGELRDAAKFEPWYWRLANIQLQVFKRGKAKARSYISYDVLSDADMMSADSYDFITEEECQELRRHIAQMSAAYRDIVVMYYYDNLSCKAIAQKLGMPEGTVTYRLMMAREKLKKECSKMTETALKPTKLNITIMGNFRNENEYPPQFINDALSQNILCHAYREPKTVEELCALTGVPAVYIEDRIENLINRDALIKPTKTTVQTDFLIFDDVADGYRNGIGYGIIEDFVTAVSEDFYEAAHLLTQKTIFSGIYTAGRSFDEIMCFLCAMWLGAIVPDLAPHYLPGKQQHFPRRYDGYRWKYIGFKVNDANDVQNFDASMGIERSMNNFEHGKMAHYNFDFAPFVYRKFLFDYELDVCQAVLQGEVLYQSYFKSAPSVAENALERSRFSARTGPFKSAIAIDDKQKEIAAALIAKGFLARGNDSEMVCAVPVFSKEQHDIFAETAASVFAQLMPVYAGKIKTYVNGYAKVFPKHLKEDAMFNGIHVFAAMLKVIVNDWVLRGKIVIPDGAVCDALIML
ncbi:MAG: sigma-70 family RNA polymerase sigma factor [Defluviitaleaceae bacterium]|nr:sigma-70 family RNA polymerase sigma factor [Defluviitaleaceae bacterium]